MPEGSGLSPILVNCNIPVIYVRIRNVKSKHILLLIKYLFVSSGLRVKLMIHQIVTRVSFDSFRERALGKRVILLYPWTNYRTLFLTHFLDNAQDGVLYFRIPAGADTLDAWLGLLVDDIREALPEFGDHLSEALDGGSAEDLGAALAVDLNALAGSPVTLFLDELDRVDFDDRFNAFIFALVEGLGSEAQIAVSSRLLTYESWRVLVERGDAAILGAEYRKNDVMFTVDGEVKPQIEIYASGRGHALVNGKEITNWDGALPRNLFFYFVDNPLVTRDDIFRTFWPKLSVKEATNVYHVTKRKISERISFNVDDGENYELTRYSSGFYMPSDKIVRHYDMGDFQEAVEQAIVSQDPREATRLYQQAVDLYRAPFLETIQMPWVEERRRLLQRLYAQALVGLGRDAAAAGRMDEALGYFTRATRETPEREDIHRNIMQIYIDRGMLEDAKNQYAYMSRYLKETFKIKPCDQTKALFDSIN